MEESEREKAADASSHPAERPLSKNQQKKLKRKQEWEEGREERKKIRKEKAKDKKEQKRAAYQERQNDSTNTASTTEKPKLERRHRPTQLPITFVFDCQYDELMTDNEQVSLAGQITRSYSDNRKSAFKAHIIISSFGGSLKQRYDGLLNGHPRSWQGVSFIDGDFVEAAKQADAHMRSPAGGKLAGAFALHDTADADVESQHQPTGEVVYLSSDSSETLASLKPYSTYIIGGLVDRNRHKGVCYKKAMDAKVQTAKLPIGEFLQMAKGTVLTTNHVCQIMLKWLELGDWGQAFMEVIPKRKGGVLKGSTSEAGSSANEDTGEEKRGGEKDKDEHVGQDGQDSVEDIAINGDGDLMVSRISSVSGVDESEAPITVDAPTRDEG